MNIRTGDRVAAARQSGRPIIALETTVITHGLEPPDNLEVALAMEQTILDQGCCPATLGILDGELVVGMSRSELELFSANAQSVSKCSRRDLPVVVGHSGHGSLTVAGTMWAAHRANIDVMATGGIGGVHRGHPFDVSADLTELGRTPVAVVCAGAKSILDLPLTMEVLETQGVPVIGLGTDTLPAFFHGDSGIALAASADLDGAAATLAAWRKLPPEQGLLFTVPVPPGHALETEEAERAIGQATAEADEQGITGSRVTPFVLKRVAELTDGRSVAANKALLINNARVAARLALGSVEH
ncbi:MAG: pseudouridine-5'-phosphate glycosidase [Xanthomonadales bacterium]|nr:pseudouridine-5'-phosphate glycosidase [Xanthomonadales bacterium]